MPKGRGRKDSDSDAATEDQGTVGTFETLRDEGEHFVHVQQYEKAIESFTKALEMRNDDKTCLVVRAKCFLMLGNSEKALDDANTALAQDDDGVKDIRALNMKAEALYQKGDFETALVFYHRGNKLRPELQEFRLGIQKCQEAIDNSIGSPSSVKLQASGDLSYFYKDEEKKQQQKGYTKINQPQKKEEKKDRQRPKDGSNSKTTKELLGQLYRDKEYLEKLFDGLSNSNTQTDSYIKGRACDGLEYLTVRSDFWRQQKPMYARKRDRQKTHQRGSAGPRGDLMKYCLMRLEEIDEAQSEGRYHDSLSKSKKTLAKVEDMPEESLKNKYDVIANLYSCMGNAYLELAEYDDALDCHNKDLALARDYEINEAESRALDNLGRTYAKMGEYGEAIEIWKRKLPKSKSPLESTWLYHEIGRCYLELSEYQEAKDYGEKSLAAAREAEDKAWELHATVLVAQSEVKCDELEAASDSFTQALELAEEQKDSSAQSAIKKALEDVNDRIVQGGHHEDDEEHKEETADADSQHGDKPSPKQEEPPKTKATTKEPPKEEKKEPQETKEADSDETKTSEKKEEENEVQESTENNAEEDVNEKEEGIQEEEDQESLKDDKDDSHGDESHA